MESFVEHFPQCLRVQKRRDYVQIQKYGEKILTKHFILCILKRNNDPEGLPHIGITITKKVGKSYIRNRIRRIIREIFRKNNSFWVKGVNIVVIVKESSDLSILDYWDIDAELNSYLRKI